MRVHALLPVYMELATNRTIFLDITLRSALDTFICVLEELFMLEDISSTFL
jgi:hypothetical protein